ncbi:hypothetical protein MYCTH_2300713 [Thermothelomyces thermophilus ATCC 42464]|uniref:Nuclear cap-binding protein subunit 3 n=1 Tax=Thermothelomyces thermophilus (strain ATCC 42464 / BCRC 31852 / DSM 1799) TaxID=573729 RepID=G2Q7Y6_THET4|nr:uncharacterized protein MYCTH_2300713 [Thermothelomyces thermophilus ATCC 42464]AEO56143.1 hypothetical protein MYCTH_2300713 [Thermothelomyces thermophilus ATCC 42464]
MDLDIEMDVDDVQDMPVPAIPAAYTEDVVAEDEQEPGEVEEGPNGGDNGDASDKAKAPVPYKVHIKGLDTFNPDDVKGYLAEHYSTSELNRVEWIDDTCANYIFKSDRIAQEALVALAAVEIADVTQLPPLENIPAKSYSQKPECSLLVRFAVEGDKKVAGAAERSRFYLLHPEYDPGERRRRGELGRGRYRDRDDRYRRDRRNDRRRDSRDEEEPESFDVNLYDDDESALATRARRRSRPRRRSMSRSSDTRGAAQRNRDKELFPDKLSGSLGRSLRDRSASPVRDRDGDAEMDLDEAARAAAAMRSRERGRSIKERLSRDNSTKELFPSKEINRKKELFPSKVNSSGGGGTAQMDKVNDTTVLTTASLADRITAPSAGGFSIRGMANKRSDDQGIAIKGTGPTVRELFPEKFGTNAGKELFAEKLEGRGKRRQKAEDMFT